MKVSSKRAIPFSAQVPEARDVRVTGDFTDWSRGGLPMWNEGDGSWRTLLSLSPGIYEYRLIVDGDWAFGDENCILTVLRS